MTLRPELEEIVADFADSPRELRLELLLEFARSLPDLPARYAEDRSRLEQVHECQTPFFVAAEVEGGITRLFFDAPPEAPTTRGFAGVLSAGLDGAPVHEILETPADFYAAMQLGELISPLRLRGMSAILAAVKRQVAAAAVAPT